MQTTIDILREFGTVLTALGMLVTAVLAVLNRLDMKQVKAINDAQTLTLNSVEEKANGMATRFAEERHLTGLAEGEMIGRKHAADAAAGIARAAVDAAGVVAAAVVVDAQKLKDKNNEATANANP